MKLNYYKPFYSTKQKKWCPGVKPISLDDASFDMLINDKKTAELVAAYQGGDKEAKTQIPAICWTGICLPGTKRSVVNMLPTHLFMVDVDHCGDPRGAWAEIRQTIIERYNDVNYEIVLAHITPSGQGLRIVARCTQDFATLQEHMEWLKKELSLEKYGDFDACTKDVSRLSFAVPADYILYRSQSLFDDVTNKPIKTVHDVTKQSIEDFKTSGATQSEYVESDENEHKEQYEKFKSATYRGTKLTTIIEKYVEEYGEPGDGERHAYYNTMVKNFRCIADNNVRLLHALLPRFGHTYQETLSQCQSICRANTLSRIPKDFWMFLYHNGFYEKKATGNEKAEDEYLMNAPAVTTDLTKMPPLPPVFREIVATMPDDFKIPCINALMPILGTITSHLRADYLDNKEMSTEFFSIIYAPPGTGKSFMEPHMDKLFENLELRDLLTSERENLYNQVINKKGSNEKSPEQPMVTQFIMPTKNSETDLLCKMQANKGHHMFTYAPEMDSWRKGVHAAGGNKDDMIRIAWDNGKYGQSFKSANSFKGTVNLFWNVLICGTLDQINAYFTNVTNGLVSRCCFTAIENQEFVDVPEYKKLTKKALEVITKWRDRMDAEVFKDALDFDPEVLWSVSDEDFDKEVPWKYAFKPFKHVDMKWIFPTIRKFLKETLKESALNIDHAEDSYRRRAAVRGFRLALLCTSLYINITEKEKKVIKDFVAWWMPQDLRGVMNLFGDQYNSLYEKSQAIVIHQRSIFDALDNTFTREDLFVQAKKLGKKTKSRKILSDWLKFKAISRTENPDIFTKNKV